jgi:hypothetical protein
VEHLADPLVSEFLESNEGELDLIFAQQSERIAWRGRMALADDWSASGCMTKSMLAGTGCDDEDSEGCTYQ